MRSHQIGMHQLLKSLVPVLALLSQPVAAQISPYQPVSQESRSSAPRATGDHVSARAAKLAPSHRSAYGPFRVLDASHASMRGVTDDRSPGSFAAMMRDHPGIAMLEMINCPGTEDDSANLRLGRMIHANKIATHVPANGWVASGAVELFLAGSRHSAHPGARFAVHSWEDDSGRGPQSYAPNAPENRAYLDYYRAIGMNPGAAAAFYAMTNSTPFSRPRYLSASEMAPWMRRGTAAASRNPTVGIR